MQYEITKQYSFGTRNTFPFLGMFYERKPLLRLLTLLEQQNMNAENRKTYGKC